MTQSHISLRPAVPEDLSSINAIIARAIESWALPERVKRLTLPSLQYNQTDLDFQDLWVAELEKTIVGMSTWEEAGRSDCLDNSPTLLLHGIYVDPEAQGQGVGKTLFRQAEAASQAMAMAGIIVKAQKGSEGFYRAMGMSPLPVTDASRHFERRFSKRFAAPAR